MANEPNETKDTKNSVAKMRISLDVKVPVVEDVVVVARDDA
jgi:hypothetical protein